MRIQGYRVEYHRETKSKMGLIGTVDLQGNPLTQDCWKIHIHVKSFNINKEKFKQISNYIINYLFQEGFITMDIPVKFQVFDIIGKPIYINKFPQNEY